MRHRAILSALAAGAFIGTALSVAAAPAQADHGGFHVSGSTLLDANGTPFVFRGTSVPHVWFPQNFGQFADVAGLGANAVRVVLGSGDRWGPNSAADVANVIAECKRLEMVCMLEVHDTTGFGEEGAAASLDEAVDYWISIGDALRGEEAYVLVNIGNEPRGNNNAQAWVAETQDAIQRMRSEGAFTHTLVVDAPNWGQDWQNPPVMQSNAPAVFAADPLGNTLFSIHMYEVYGLASAITNYFNAFQQMDLPLVVGEFGHVHNGQNVDEDTIMAEAQSRGIGWLAWSWSGNSGGAEPLDQAVNFNPNNLTQWGQRVFAGPNGIAQTAQCATVYDCDGGSDDTTPPTAPGVPVASNIGQTTATLSWAASTDDVGVVAYDVYREAGATNPLLGSSPTTSIDLGGLSPGTSYTVYVRARDAAGNMSPPSPTGAFTTEGGGGGGTCEVDYNASPWTEQPGVGGFTAHITITNTGGTALNGWTLQFTMPAGQSFTHGWAATWPPPGTTGTLTASNLSWNAVLSANGGTTTIGFNGRWTDSYTDPASFTLNGGACTAV